jgi:hypothetical protein
MDRSEKAMVLPSHPPHVAVAIVHGGDAWDREDLTKFGEKSHAWHNGKKRLEALIERDRLRNVAPKIASE